MVIVVGHAVGQAVVHLGSLAGEGGQVVLVGAKVNHRRGGLAALRLAVPGEVELGLVCAGGEGYLGVVGGYGLPLAGDAAVVIIGRGGQGHGAGAQDQRAGEDAGQDLVAFLHAFLLPLQFGFGSMEPGGSIAPAAPSYKAPFQSFPEPLPGLYVSAPRAADKKKGAVCLPYSRRSFCSATATVCS